jgi:outer membrane lipoprotein-sorting protein
MRPFFVYDPDGASKWLHDRKFVTYYDDFTDITNMDLTKPANVAPFLSILSEQPRSYWQKKLVDLNQKIVYNKQQFYKYVDDQKLKVQKGILCPI